MFENEDEMIVYLDDLAEETNDPKLSEIANALAHLISHEKSKNIQQTFENDIHFV